jgi:hypothetical protein
MFGWFKKKKKPLEVMTRDQFFDLLSKNVEPYNIQVYDFSTTDGIDGISYFIHNQPVLTCFNNGAVYEYKFGIKSPNVYLIEFNQRMINEYTQLLINKIEEYKKYQVTRKLEEIKSDFE